MSDGMPDFPDFRALTDSYARKTEDFLIARMTGRVGVDVRKPKWLPAFVWRWMWRHVVIIEERPNFSLEWPAPPDDSVGRSSRAAK